MNTIVDLNGEWEFLWDDDDVGIVNRWYANPQENTEKIQVPHVWERSFKKMFLTQDTGYYFKHFFVDKNEISKRIFLNFERIASHALVWLNGKLIGEHFGSYSSFTLETSKAIKLGESNFLVIRVANIGAANSRIDFGTTVDFKGKTRERYAQPKEMPVGLPWTQYPFGGIYGSVSLTLGNAVFISDLQVEPDIDQERVAVAVSFNNPRNHFCRLRILMKNPKGEVSEIYKDLKIEKENGSHRFNLEIKDWKEEDFKWTLEKPRLFAIEVQIESKTTKTKPNPDYSFSVVKNFAFRKFDCIKGDFYFNDSIIKIHGLHYSQHWSEGGLWTSANEKLRKDLQKVKKLNFNAIRSTGAPLSNEALDICDELGLLVFQEFPVHMMRSTDQGLDYAKDLIKDIILEQKHHPSIVAWVIGAENGTLVLENGTKLLKHIDLFDLTRPAISNLNSVYLDNEESFVKDTGKLMGITNERILLHAAHRLHIRMSPSANLSYFLSLYGSKEGVEDVIIPDSTLGDSQFQDNYENFVKDINGKLLVTLKNHTLLPKDATSLKGPRGSKNDKAVKAFYKQLNSFVDDKKLSIWSSVKDFIENSKQIAIRSKLAQSSALLSNPLVAGYFLDQWADFGTDFSGLMDENRKSKDLDDFIKELTTPTKILISGFENVVSVNSQTTFQLAFLNHDRFEEIDIELLILDSSGKEVFSQKKTESVGKTSLIPLGLHTIKCPKKEGLYTFQLTLLHKGKKTYQVKEELIVIQEIDLKSAMKQVCFLDNSVETKDALASLQGSENIIFTANLSSWNDEILEKIVDATKNKGKTLLLSDMTSEDVETFNASHLFDFEIESHFSTGANELSLHYLPKASKLLSVFNQKNVLDHTASAVMPSVSLNELEGAKVYARSVSIIKSEIKTGVDLQVLPFGKGNIIFNQFNVFEGLETTALADALFAKIITLV